MNLDRVEIPTMTARDVCQKLLRENLGYVNVAADAKNPDARIVGYINIDVSCTAEEMLAAAREIGMLPPALDKQKKRAGCETCKGKGVVPDGELTHSEGGIPYENGPIKQIKDCPHCS